MANFSQAGKSAAYNVTNSEGDKPIAGERKRAVLVGVIASLSTALVVGAIFCGVTFYLQQNHINEKDEWVSWTRRAGKIDIHESVLINEDEQTVLMVSAEAYKIKGLNSMALHDFKLGYVALRVLRHNHCLVKKVKNPDFKAVKTMLEARKGKQLDLQLLEQFNVRTPTMTPSELGPKLSIFCEGTSAHWMDTVPKSRVVKREDTFDYEVGCILARDEVFFQ